MMSEGFITRAEFFENEESDGVSCELHILDEREEDDNDELIVVTTANEAAIMLHARQLGCFRRSANGNSKSLQNGTIEARQQEVSALMQGMKL